MRHRVLVFLILAALGLSRAAEAPAERPDSAEAAWNEVNQLHASLRPPPAWTDKSPTQEERTAFQRQVREAAWTFSRKAREFASRFPTNENVAEARVMAVYALSHAVAAGDETAEKEINTYVAAVVADTTIPEDDRAAVLLYAGNVPFMKKVGMRLFTVGLQNLHEEFESNSIEATRAALKSFPTNSMIYTMLVAIAQRSPPERQQAVAREIVSAPGAPAGAKALAEHLLKGTRPYQLGKPIDIQFTALDGREVDLAKLKGKVVLVDFWSTSCGPCIAELPGLKATYEKFHERGFEVIGISLDDKESVLKKFIADKKIAWPQHFDGKGWENKFAVRYGIFSIPTVWIVNKRGNLVSVEARGDAERTIEALLAEK